MMEKIHSFLGKAINQEYHVQVTGALEGISPNLSALWVGLIGFEVGGVSVVGYESRTAKC
jgi:hypothetical protein